MMNGRRKSDRLTVPAKSPNEAGSKAAEEGMEGNGRAKGNQRQQSALRTPGRAGVSIELARVRHTAVTKREERFTALLHHIYNVVALRKSYYCLSPQAAAGVDGETWKHYGENLESNLRDLSERLKRGAYRATPVRRVFIPKADGRQRPLGVPVLEDKIVQRAAVEVLNAIYEADFIGFSYGLRPGRNQHHALDALYVGLMTKKVNWVLDADIRGFYDAIDHECLVKFLERRIADKRVIRLVQKWLNAGVMEDGEWHPSEEGTPQGGSISPLLANIYLHYAFDLWANDWRGSPGRGEVILIRYADDIVVGFQHRTDAEQFLADFREQLARVHLELHPAKTRLIEFGRFAAKNRERRGEGRPEPFNFLGFTHICGTTQRGSFTVVRQTMSTRLRGKLRELKQTLRKRMHQPVNKLGAWLRSVITGHLNYYAVPTNKPALDSFRYQVCRLWHRTLNRRSQKARVSWERMKRYLRRWIPNVHIVHPYPLHRMGVTT